ncbi:unnamed protein product, partial [Prorocentrum cordatum]
GGSAAPLPPPSPPCAMGSSASQQSPGAAYGTRSAGVAGSGSGSAASASASRPGGGGRPARARAAAAAASWRQQEADDESFARRLQMQEVAASFGPGLRAGGAVRPGRPAPGGARAGPTVTARAACPFCSAENEVVAPSGLRSSQGALRCGSCSRRFQVEVPRDAEAMPMRVCRNCGVVNQFPAPAPGEPAPSVMCGACGHVTQAPRRSAADLAGATHRCSPRGTCWTSTPARGATSRRRNIGISTRFRGSARLLPLAVLQALVREQHGNPAHGSDIDALPTRTLQGIGHLGEQTKCLICLEDFGDGDDVMTLPCLHIYHKKCVEQWLGCDNSCPVCKTPIGGSHSG